MSGNFRDIPNLALRCFRMESVMPQTSSKIRPEASIAAVPDQTVSRPHLDLKKITTPILLHLLAREMRFPLFFMLRCKFTAPRFRKTIDPRFPAELVDICALPLWVYINLKKRLGQGRRSRSCGWRS